MGLGARPRHVFEVEAELWSMLPLLGLIRGPHERNKYRQDKGEFNN